MYIFSTINKYIYPHSPLPSPLLHVLLMFTFVYLLHNGFSLFEFISFHPNSKRKRLRLKLKVKILIVSSKYFMFPSNKRYYCLSKLYVSLHKYKINCPSSIHKYNINCPICATLMLTLKKYFSFSTIFKYL